MHAEHDLLGVRRRDVFVRQRRTSDVIRRFGAAALVAGLALTGAALANSGIRAAPGPFVPTGIVNGGSTSGSWGDRSPAGEGLVLGCLSRRHYSLAITVRNRSRRPVTLTGVRGPNPLPRVVDRVAVQLRKAPSSTGDVPQPLLRQWSAAPLEPLTIRPGRNAVVQSDFLLRHCNSLPRGRDVVVPGSFVLSYRQAGHAARQRVEQAGAAFGVGPGPIIRSCGRVAGAVSLVAADIGCALAREAAPACRHMPHRTWGSCLAGGRRWGCHLHSSRVQQCSFEYRPSRWYEVRWPKR